MDATKNAIAQAYEQSANPANPPRTPPNNSSLFVPAVDFRKFLEAQKMKNDELQARANDLQIQIINLNRAFDSHFFWSKVFSGGLAAIIIFLLLFPPPAKSQSSEAPITSSSYPAQSR